MHNYIEKELIGVKLMSALTLVLLSRHAIRSTPLHCLLYRTQVLHGKFLPLWNVTLDFLHLLSCHLYRKIFEKALSLWPSKHCNLMAYCVQKEIKITLKFNPKKVKFLQCYWVNLIKFKKMLKTNQIYHILFITVLYATGFFRLYVPCK